MDEACKYCISPGVTTVHYKERCPIGSNDEVKRLQDELETERMRVVACGAAALQNSTKSMDRIGNDNPYWTASYGDVCNAVDREMKYRTALQQIILINFTGEQCAEYARNALEVNKP